MPTQNVFQKGTITLGFSMVGNTVLMGSLVLSMRFSVQKIVGEHEDMCESGKIATSPARMCHSADAGTEPK